ncbi:MAG: glycerophosphodiester phosphodiesterase [Candidatus Accumulibacter sp.]|nr:glycerophosphodiester phosphodiesterase [Accumulibacter sp.]
MTLNFAHRGFSARYPENTLLAFRQAIAAGCDGIELDVHLSRDGTPVIIHDEDTLRTTGVPGQVGESLYSDLRRLDAGQGEPVPSLEEYLDLVASLPVITNIELKNDRVHYAGLEEKVLDMTRRRKLERRIIFSSFNHDSVIKCKALAPDSPCGFLIEQAVEDPAAYLRRHGVEYFHPDYRLLSGPFGEAAFRDRLALHVWTVNDRDGFDDLLYRQVRGIITNDPPLLNEIRGRQGLT